MPGNVRYAFGPFELDAHLRALSRAGEPVRLTPKDVDLLLVLVERRGQLVDKEALFEAVWGPVIVEDCNLARHVANLRRVLADDPERPTFIETTPRRGYRFVAPVVESPRPDQAAAAPPAALATAVPLEESSPAVPPERLAQPAGRRRTLQRVAWAAAVLLLLAVLPAATSLVGSGRGHGAIRSLAVLPVTNLTGDTRHDHLAEALGEMTVNDLGRLQRSRTDPLRILPCSAARSYRATGKPAAQIGDELGVDGLVEASVLQADGRIRLSAVLVDARSGAVAWAQEVEGETADFLELQDDLVFGLASHLGLGPSQADLPLAGRHAPAGPAVRPSREALQTWEIPVLWPATAASGLGEPATGQLH